MAARCSESARRGAHPADAPAGAQRAPGKQGRDDWGPRPSLPSGFRWGPGTRWQPLSAPSGCRVRSRGVWERVTGAPASLRVRGTAGGAGCTVERLWELSCREERKRAGGVWAVRASATCPRVGNEGQAWRGLRVLGKRHWFSVKWLLPLWKSPVAGSAGTAFESRCQLVRRRPQGQIHLTAPAGKDGM